MEQIWVKPDANLPEKVSDEPIVITKAMKDAIKALDEITVQKVKSIVQGTSSDAKRAIEELADAEEIVTREERYETLYPTAVEPGDIGEVEPK